MNEPLSPAAQFVVDAWDAKLNPDPYGLTYLIHDQEREALAAALRVVADQVVDFLARDQLLAIAAELGAQ